MPAQNDSTLAFISNHLSLSFSCFSHLRLPASLSHVNIPQHALTLQEVGLRLAVGWCKPWLLSVWLNVCQADEPISVIYLPQQSLSDNVYIFLLTVMPTFLLLILCVRKRRPPLEIFPCSSKGLGQSSSGVETAFSKLFTRMSAPEKTLLLFFALSLKPRRAMPCI